MPEYSENYIASKQPFSAEILVRQESHTITQIKDNGYHSAPIPVDGGILLKVNVSASSLPELKKKIEGHIALIE